MAKFICTHSDCGSTTFIVGDVVEGVAKAGAIGRAKVVKTVPVSHDLPRAKVGETFFHLPLFGAMWHWKEIKDDSSSD